MEKQRKQKFFESCRRLLISLLLFLTAGTIAAQSITLEQLRLLLLVPEEGQNLYTKTDIKFTVTIPNVRASQIQVLSAEQDQDITFRTIRKTEDYIQNGTTI